MADDSWCAKEKPKARRERKSVEDDGKIVHKYFTQFTYVYIMYLVHTSRGSRGDSGAPVLFYMQVSFDQLPPTLKHKNFQVNVTLLKIFSAFSRVCVLGKIIFSYAFLHISFKQNVKKKRTTSQYRKNLCVVNRVEIPCETRQE